MDIIYDTGFSKNEDDGQHTREHGEADEHHRPPRLLVLDLGLHALLDGVVLVHVYDHVVLYVSRVRHDGAIVPRYVYGRIRDLSVPQEDKARDMINKKTNETYENLRASRLAIVLRLFLSRGSIALLLRYFLYIIHSILRQLLVHAKGLE